MNRRSFGLIAGSPSAKKSGTVVRVDGPLAVVSTSTGPASVLVGGFACSPGDRVQISGNVVIGKLLGGSTSPTYIV